MSRAVYGRLQALTEESLTRLKALIEDRAIRGVPCDSHGDLRLDHVYWFPHQSPPQDIVIIDCIEFNLRYRAADPVADMAFLVMDLIRTGRRDLADWFCDAYFEAAGDEEGRELVSFYVAYRALVRAKVDGMKSQEAEVPADERTRADSHARAEWLLALGELARAGRRPCLVLVGGLPGTGKSTVARSLACEARFDVIRSDSVRKELAAAAAADTLETLRGYEAGIYTAEWTERTYQECLARARNALFEGKRVLVDATFGRESHRRWFLDLASRWAVPAVLLLCRADAAIVRSRLENRRHDVSDADWAIYLQAAERWEPPGAGTERSTHPIETGDGERPLVRALEFLRELRLWD